jgi:hypothetical protein
MANLIPCGKCQHFDVIIRGADKTTKRGWCIHRSKYPAKEGPGQIFPPTAQRVNEGELAQPFIVRKLQVIEQCQFVVAAPQDPVVRKTNVIKATLADKTRVLR